MKRLKLRVEQNKDNPRLGRAWLEGHEITNHVERLVIDWDTKKTDGPKVEITLNRLEIDFPEDLEALVEIKKFPKIVAYSIVNYPIMDDKAQIEIKPIVDDWSHLEAMPPSYPYPEDAE